MTPFRRCIITTCFAVAFIAQLGLAQNIQRIEEEAVKDKERDAKMQEFLRRRQEEEEKVLSQPITSEELTNTNQVEVEPNNILPSDLATIYSLVPYRVRRPRWGHQFTLTYSQFHPRNYQSDYDPSAGESAFDDLYGSAQTPLIEMSYAYKWNFMLGSLGGELAYGTYRNEGAVVEMGNAVLSLQMIRAGLKYTADNFMYEPIFAPYGMIGVYTALYDESQEGATFDGSTGPAIYYGAGMNFQLGWLDKTAAVDAYTESGIENTYIFVEVRQYLASAEDQDPDFSTDFDLNFGLSLEF